MPLSPGEAFGKAVRAARRERGLSQEEAAREVGIDRAYFGHVERATKAPTLTTIWRVAEALQVSPAELFARAEELVEKSGGTAPGRGKAAGTGR